LSVLIRGRRAGIKPEAEEKASNELEFCKSCLYRPCERQSIYKGRAYRAVKVRRRLTAQKWIVCERQRHGWRVLGPFTYYEALKKAA
jgi:hypothetical protein